MEIYSIDIPKTLIDKYIKDFDVLPGSSDRDAVYYLRDAIQDIMTMVAMDPDMLEDPVCKKDFIKAIAMKEALIEHGIYYDS